MKRASTITALSILCMVLAGCAEQITTLSPTPTTTLSSTTPVPTTVPTIPCLRDGQGFCTKSGDCCNPLFCNLTSKTCQTIPNTTPKPTPIPTTIPTPTPTPVPTPEPCGGLSQKCCTESTCNNPTSLACSGNNTCIACGSFGQPCCTNARCEQPQTCTLNETTLGCWPSPSPTPTPQPCGGHLQQCCSGSICNTPAWTCNATNTCITTPQGPTPTPGPSTTCLDDDNGIRIFVQGTATGNYGSTSGPYGSFTDYCETYARMVEYYCTNATEPEGPQIENGWVENVTANCACFNGHC